MIHRCLLRGLLILLAVCSGRSASATQTDVLIRLGDSAYSRKAYDSAGYYYGLAAAMNNPDAVVLYKLGNAYFRLRHTGKAVLAYERALQRRPGFTDAAENLAVIQRRIQPDATQDDVFLIRWWRALTRPSLSDAWALAGIFCFFLSLGGLAWSRFVRRRPSWLRPQFIAGGIVLSLLFAVLSAAAVTGTVSNAGVIMRQDAPFRTGATSGKAGILNLPEGLVVKVLRSEPNEVLVALPDGREGFIQAADIEFVQ